MHVREKNYLLLHDPRNKHFSIFFNFKMVRSKERFCREDVMNNYTHIPLLHEIRLTLHKVYVTRLKTLKLSPVDETMLFCTALTSLKSSIILSVFSLCLCFIFLILSFFDDYLTMKTTFFS